MKLETAFGRSIGLLVENTSLENIRNIENSMNIVVDNQQEYYPENNSGQKIFIGHGNSSDWRKLKDHLRDKHGKSIEAYEVGSRAGHSIRDVLEEMLDGSELAIFVHTPEDELNDGTYNTRSNVIHETGLFQGKLGFSKAIVLLHNDTNEFSNISGIQQIRYSKINETFGDIIAWINREES